MVTIDYPEVFYNFQSNYMLERGVRIKEIFDLLIEESIKKRYDPSYIMSEEVIERIFVLLMRPVVEDKEIFLRELVEATSLTIEYFLTYNEIFDRFYETPKVDKIIANTLVIK